MSDINSKDRSIVEFKVRYSTGIHTSGRKKGQEKTEKLIQFIKIIDNWFCLLSTRFPI